MASTSGSGPRSLTWTPTPSRRPTAPCCPRGPWSGRRGVVANPQGCRAAANVAASLGDGTARDYRHSDRGFVVDLGGAAVVANPLHVAMRGPVAAAITRGYHVLAMPTVGNRVRLLTDWALDVALGPHLVDVAALEP